MLHFYFLLYHCENTYLENISAIARSIAQGPTQVGVVEEAVEKKPGEVKFEGVI